MGFLDVLKGIGNIGLNIGASFIPGGSIAKDAIKAGIGAAGSTLGAINKGQASNRDAQFAGQMDLERLLAERDRDYWNQTLQREQEGRASGSDAWRKLLAAQHTLSPGAHPSLSPYSVAPRQATDVERQGADAMTQEVMARLTGGNQLAMPTRRALAVDPKLLQPGKLEQISGYLSPALNFLGQYKIPQTRPVMTGDANPPRGWTA